MPAADAAIDYERSDYVEEIARLSAGSSVNVVLDTIGGKTLERSAHVLADGGRVVALVDLATPQNLNAAWGVNAEYHFVFTRQNRGKLLALKTLLERGLIPSSAPLRRDRCGAYRSGTGPHQWRPPSRQGCH